MDEGTPSILLAVSPVRLAGELMVGVDLHAT